MEEEEEALGRGEVRSERIHEVNDEAYKRESIGGSRAYVYVGVYDAYVIVDLLLSYVSRALPVGVRLHYGRESI